MTATRTPTLKPNCLFWGVGFCAAFTTEVPYQRPRFTRLTAPAVHAGSPPVLEENPCQACEHAFGLHANNRICENPLALFCDRFM